MRFASEAPRNTDDRPPVAHRAPHVTYAPVDAPRNRLLALLPQLAVVPGELLAATAAEDEARLVAYRSARDRFVAAGRHVRPVPDVRAMLVRAGTPPLDVLHTGAEFRPAYDPPLGLAGALVHSDAAGARTLLAPLTRRQPARPEAGWALATLSGH